MKKKTLDILNKKGIKPGISEDDNHKNIENDSFQDDEIITFVHRENIPSKWLHYIKDREIDLPFISQHIDLSQTVFFDTETTGLYSGGGSLAFLAGMGKIIDDKLEVTQLLIPAYSTEKQFLDVIADCLHNSYCITYNGLTYDIPLIKHRILFQHYLHKTKVDDIINQDKIIDFKKHIDLLYTARRLYRNKLPGCSLGIIEKEILEIERGEDIPGEEIPDIFFEYLKNPQINDNMKLVLSHNKQDIVTLIYMLFYFIDIFMNKKFHGINNAKISKYLLKIDDTHVEDILLSGINENDIESMLLLAMKYKKEKKYHEALFLWNKIIDIEEIDFLEEPYEEIAKYYEHVEKKYDFAMSICEDALKKMEIQKLNDKFLDMNSYNNFNKRIKRLAEKIKKMHY